MLRLKELKIRSARGETKGEETPVAVKEPVTSAVI